MIRLLGSNAFDYVGYSMQLSSIGLMLYIFAIINTKIFLGILFCTIISFYGIMFKFLQIDLLRLKKQEKTYWLDVEQTKPQRIRKQY